MTLILTVLVAVLWVALIRERARRIQAEQTTDLARAAALLWRTVYLEQHTDPQPDHPEDLWGA